MPSTGSFQIPVPFTGQERRCPRCSSDHKPFADHAGLVRHLRNIHRITDIKFVCGFCGHTDPLLKRLSLHLKTAHKDQVVKPPTQPREMESDGGGAPGEDDVSGRSEPDFKIGKKGRNKLVLITYPPSFNNAPCPLCTVSAPKQLNDLDDAVTHFHSHRAEVCYRCGICDSRNEELEWALRHHNDCHADRAPADKAPTKSKAEACQCTHPNAVLDMGLGATSEQDAPSPEPVAIPTSRAPSPRRARPSSASIHVAVEQPRSPPPLVWLPGHPSANQTQETGAGAEKAPSSLMLTQSLVPHRLAPASATQANTAPAHKTFFKLKKVSKPTELQMEWVRRVAGVGSQESLDELVEGITKAIRAIVEERSTGHRQSRTASSLPAPEQARRLQRMFRENKRGAFREITETRGPRCNIPHDALIKHYAPQVERDVASSQDGILSTEEEDWHNPIKENFTPQEVWNRLVRCSNTAPGVDRIRYLHWKKFDPSSHILSALFTRCASLRLIPSLWKRSRTILFHKDGDLNDPGNWRPISLISTAAKLFAGCLARRLMALASATDLLAPQQKGFMPSEGCLEHNFALRSMLQDAKRHRQTCVVVWLDLKNAFGSVPHRTIAEALMQKRIHPACRRLLGEYFFNCVTEFVSGDEASREVPVSSGVRQGCPLSPLVFNIAVDEIIRQTAAMASSHGYSLYGQTHSVLAYADDLVLISHCPRKMQEMLSRVGEEASRRGLSFKPGKCASLHIDGASHSVSPTTFMIHGGAPVTMTEDDSYRHLGVPTGFSQFVDIESSAEEISALMDKVGASLLAPWQKFEATNIFILPRLSFIMKSGFVKKGPLKTIDIKLIAAAKEWTSLPPRASTEIFFLPNHKGGMNLFPLATLNDISTVAQAEKFLRSKDSAIKSLALSSLTSVVQKRIKTDTSMADITAYLDGSTEGGLGNGSNDFSTLWARARSASARLRKSIKFSWVLTDPDSLSIAVDGAPPGPSTEKVLKRACRDKFLQRLIAKPSQGMVFSSTSQSSVANHFLREGNFTRFADWRFVHRARLNVLEVNKTPYHLPGTLNCRKCTKWDETVRHVLNNCTQNMRLITERHNRVLGRLFNALPDEVRKRTKLDSTVIQATSTGRPDLVVTNEATKEVIMVDVTIPFDSGPRAMEDARRIKLEKYKGIEEELSAKGYKVVNEAFVIGSLGSFPSRNFLVSRALGINSNYAKVMARLMVSDTIRWSRDIYCTHVTGVAQERPRDLERLAHGASGEQGVVGETGCAETLATGTPTVQVQRRDEEDADAEKTEDGEEEDGDDDIYFEF